MGFPINPPNAPLVGRAGIASPDWYRFFANLQRVTGGAKNPTDTASFLLLDPSPTLGAYRVLAPVIGEITATDFGPGGNYSIGLAVSGVSAGSYGGASQTVSFTVDAKGRITAAAAANLITTNVTEGANLYFTNARARSALTASGGISYNSGTGAFSLDATLDALAGLNATPGLVEQTGADTFTKRAIGVAATTSIPTRADADARYVRQDQTSAWANPTGTLTRTTFAAYAGQTISNPPTQAEVQAIDDHVKAMSERLAALITDLRTINALT